MARRPSRAGRSTPTAAGRLRRRPGADSADPSTTAPTTTRRRIRACSSRRSGRSRRGVEARGTRWSVTTTCWRRARSRRRRHRRVRHRRPAGPAPGPRLEPPADVDPARPPPRCSRTGSRWTRSRPADPDRRIAAGEAERRLGHPRHGLHRRPRPATCGRSWSTPSTAKARAARASRRAARPAARTAGRGALGRRLLPQPADRGGARHPRRGTRGSSPAIAGNSHTNRITAARPLLADQHLVPRRLPPASAHVPPARDAGAASRWRPGWSTTTARGLAGISRELAYLDAQGGRPQRFAGAPHRSQRPPVRQRRKRNTAARLRFR